LEENHAVLTPSRGQLVEVIDDALAEAVGREVEIGHPL
jgi:hypothetical protein